MLDPKLIKENPQAIKEMLKTRDVEFDLDGLIDTDKNRREFILKTDELRKKRNQSALEISQKKKAGEDTSGILEEMKKISSELAALEEAQNEIEKKYMH